MASRLSVIGHSDKTIVVRSFVCCVLPATKSQFKTNTVLVAIHITNPDPLDTLL